MASRAPLVLQSENLTTHQGKVAHGIKGDPLKPAKALRQERKALRDISNVGKKPLPGASKGSNLKEKSAVRGGNASSHNGFLTEEDAKRCHEWAKEGIEQTHFTGNDSQNHLKDMQEKRMMNKVEKVMSALHEWTNISYDLAIPVKKFANDTEDVMKLELEPEILPAMTSFCSTAGNEEVEDLLFESGLFDFPSLDHKLDEFKLNDDDIDDVYFWMNSFSSM